MHWKAIISYGVALAGMNALFIGNRLPLGIAVSFEFKLARSVSRCFMHSRNLTYWVGLAVLGLALLFPLIQASQPFVLSALPLHWAPEAPGRCILWQVSGLPASLATIPYLRDVCRHALSVAHCTVYRGCQRLYLSLPIPSTLCTCSLGKCVTLFFRNDCTT